MTPLDTWMTELNGSDSKAVASVNCSSHWFDESQGHRGRRAGTSRERGSSTCTTRRNIRQVGFYLPANGSTWAAYWSPTDPTHKIVYTADAYLGVDVLRIDRKADPPTMPTVTAPIPDVWLGGTTATYAPSEIWGFGCPTTNVAVA